MINALEITKSIGHKQILFPTDLNISKGQFVSVFGPNGAGKSTLLKTLALITKPTTGEITINGVNAKQSPDLIRRQIGIIAHQSFLYENLTAGENLRYYGRMYQVPQLKDRIYDVLSQVGLELSVNEPVRTFSRGMLQRLAIARAILHDPLILYLDEPFTGLDPQAARVLNGVMEELKSKGRTIFMVTHNFEEGISLSDRVIFIVRGRVVYDETGHQANSETLKELYLHKVEGVA